MQLTIEQIEKDFGFAQAYFNCKNADDLFNQLTILVKRSINENYEQFMQTLYKIDVSENKLKESMADSENVYSAIAELIIFREAQKVYIRKFYKS